MRARRRRDERRPGVRVVLTPRDEAVLRGAARFRMARTSDLLALFFHQVRRDTAMARLRRLVDAEYLNVHFPGLNEENIYSLGIGGRAWAQEQGLAVRKPPKGSCAHHLALVQVWTSLAAALAANARLRLARFEPDWELRSKVAGFEANVVPDAAVEILGRSGQETFSHRFALEVDLTTERAGVLQRKLGAYDLSPYFSGQTAAGLVVVVFGAGRHRVSVIRTLVDRGWMSQSLVCTGSEWPEALLERLMESPLTDTHSGKGNHNAASAYASSLKSRRGEGPSQ